MRIISGKFKGKKINFLKSSITRPLKDIVKENIFNILIHSSSININFNQTNILDLYSGVGSFGLECISRGAKKVTFVEEDYEANKRLIQNLENLHVLINVKVIHNKIENIYSQIKDERYDIFFFDPPFKNCDFINSLKILKKNKNYKKNHVIIIHREKKTKDNFENILETFIQRDYGRSKVIFGKFS